MNNWRLEILWNISVWISMLHFWTITQWSMLCLEAIFSSSIYLHLNGGIFHILLKCIGPDENVFVLTYHLFVGFLTSKTEELEELTSQLPSNEAQCKNSTLANITILQFSSKHWCTLSKVIKLTSKKITRIILIQIKNIHRNQKRKVWTINPQSHKMKTIMGLWHLYTEFKNTESCITVTKNTMNREEMVLNVRNGGLLRNH